MSKALRNIYQEQEVEYRKQRDAGKINHSEFANNYFLLHFGMFDYSTRQPSLIDTEPIELPK